jgi:hypothetical protein
MIGFRVWRMRRRRVHPTALGFGVPLDEVFFVGVLLFFSFLFVLRRGGPRGGVQKCGLVIGYPKQF